jgi:tetrapyrrole methylase family protein/MazG family protein
LRAPDGCPWDREQTHRSLRPYLLEEAYEALHALDGDDPAALCDELGDLLLQIVLHAQLAAESGDFTLPDVVAAISEKVVRRHPHVFGDTSADTPQEVRTRWEELKRGERAANGAGEGPLAGLPAALPALAQAQAAQRKLADSHVTTEADEPRAEGRRRIAEAGGADPGDDERDRWVGALLWALVELASRWGVDAEAALREEIDRVRAETSRLGAL